ncbi:chemotaxis protein CheW [Crassaminicella profunda]|uniref:chemotaxis protein CheW n=1 Tax=Crassaminicella profunda TaxID=1286698 RepID=UPI001CA6130A|nr:chemotaxis protein CheW [Crassaminicella profunda]QZY56772.1 chemotaxis protein CheW [Crassaminicella profunda]
MAEKITTTDNQYVLFKLDNEYYGIDILHVETIEKVMDITRVPHAAHYVEGVINLRGEVVPVINLRKRFNLPQEELNDESRIIIISVEEMVVGLLVDASSEVLHFDFDAIDEVPNFSDKLKNDYVKGIGKNEDRIIILLDLKKVLGNTDINEEM